MSRYSNNKPAAAPRKSGSSIWTGILIGVIVGAGMAAGVVWYMMRSPSQLMQKPPVEDNSAADATKPSPSVPTPASSTPPTTTPAPSDGKARFEFYNVLTDKPGAGAGAAARRSEKAAQPEKIKPVDSKPTDSKPAVVYEPQILQVGSFSTPADAEKLKAKLAMIGAEAHIQEANVPEKGVRYRVRLGPYKSEDEMSRARNFLKQNGVDSTPMHAQ